MKSYAVALHLSTTLSSGGIKNTIDLTIIKAVSSAEALGKAVMDVNPNYIIGAFKVAEILAKEEEEKTV